MARKIRPLLSLPQADPEEAASRAFGTTSDQHSCVKLWVGILISGYIDCANIGWGLKPRSETTNDWAKEHNRREYRAELVEWVNSTEPRYHYSLMNLCRALKPFIRDLHYEAARAECLRALAGHAEVSRVKNLHVCDAAGANRSRPTCDPPPRKKTNAAGSHSRPPAVA